MLARHVYLVPVAFPGGRLPFPGSSARCAVSVEPRRLASCEPGNAFSLYGDGASSHHPLGDGHHRRRGGCGTLAPGEGHNLKRASAMWA